MNPVGNMGPFGLATLKGNAPIDGVPSFRNQLPITRGGLAAEEVPFGVVVSCDPANPTHFYAGIPDDTYPVVGISMLDPTIMTNDPGMPDHYFAGRPMTVALFGVIQFKNYDVSQNAPQTNSTVWARKSDGRLAFNDGTDISSTGDGYVKLNAYVTDVRGPNGADVFFQVPIVEDATAGTTALGTCATPVADPAAGAVSEGTKITLTSDTTGAVIKYTLDGTDPDLFSTTYDRDTGIVISAACTLKAIALAEGYDPSSILEAAYTIS